MNTKGFTLIELMIVIAIIAIIAAIAIPAMLRSRLSANESSAIGALRTVGTAEASYQTTGVTTDANGVGLYATLSELGTQSPPFIDSALSTGSKAGYSFSITASGGTSLAPTYAAHATPLEHQKTGIRGFFLDESGVVRFNVSGTATSTDTALN